jgi:two-component sensor histidine kinase
LEILALRVLDKIRSRWRILTLCFVLITTAAGMLYFSRASPRLPYQDSFASGRTGEWQAYAGNWQTHDGAIRNLSEEGGAKFITGSPEWTDYSVEADVMLLGQSGDAGLIVRSSDEEDGIDSYSGYYAGLRLRNELVIGRADHGWMEYEAAPIHTALRTFKWYHLKVVAVGCDVAAEASDPETGQSTVAALREKDCARKGRIGLRSFFAGGSWRNVRAVRAGGADLLAIEQGTQVVESPETLQTEAGYSALLGSMRYESVSAQTSAMGTTSLPQVRPIKSLHLISELSPPQVTVRGNVVLTSPILYIEDATGGLAIEAAHGPSPKFGDQVQATGIIDARGFGTTLRQASVSLLWSQEPAPPLSVTAAQAATGVFDGMYVEIEGRLDAKAEIGPQSVVMSLTSGNHRYRAMLSGPRPENVFAGLLPHSLLRLRGVCAVDPELSKSLTPFILFLRSAGDVSIISGPPWWDVRHLGEIALALIPLTFIGVLIYIRAEHWKMRAVVEERSRMAREIHDTLAQNFAGIALQLESVLQKPWAKEAEVAPVALACHMARQSRKEAHRSIAALRTLHTDETLEQMLKKLLQTQAAGSSVELTVTVAGAPQRLSEEHTGQVLRIAQEAVANVLQHADAGRIDVRLVFESDSLRMEIADDGRGFDVSASSALDDGHFGITGMKERADSIKAAFAIQSDNAGTRITLNVLIPKYRGHLWQRVRWLSATCKTLIRIPALHRSTRRQEDGR